MDAYAVISLVGGLALFLYGMNVLSSGLEKLAGGRLEQALRRLTANRFTGLLLGMGITVVIQSSSALTVMLVGLVNSGILQFGQSIGVLMGSNIGTTCTAWILSLAGIESSSLWLNLLKPKYFSPLIALLGVLFLMMGKKPRHKTVGSILVGFAVLMFGMNTMSDAMEPLGESAAFASVLTAFRNPLLALLAGVVFTAVIQSSSASVGVLQALAMTGSVSWGLAVPIIMGQNIGTCVTALLSSVGVSRGAKKVAVVHLAFNLLGTLLCMIPWLILNAVLSMPFVQTSISPLWIAIVHSVFNLVTTAVLFPFSGLLERLADRIIPEREKPQQEELFDERLMTVPVFAVARANAAAVRMCGLAEKAVRKAVGLLDQFTPEDAAQVEDMECRIDRYEDQLGGYLVKLSHRELEERDSQRVTLLLHVIGDFERIGDHAVNLLGTAREMERKQLRFSHEAREELERLIAALYEILALTGRVFEDADAHMAARVEPLEQVIDGLIAAIKSRHIARLQSGSCTIELGFILTDLLINCERISDHCSNVAVAVIDAARGAWDAHEYLEGVKLGGEGGFAEDYSAYARRYALSGENDPDATAFNTDLT